VLGICRGMQIINHYFGGTLKKVSGHIGVTHSLDNGIESNSFHGYAVEEIGDGLDCIAKSEDGTIEIIKHNKHKIYAAMHHPERISPFRECDIKFVKEYFD
jgi:putative glutamine amidotransferase